VKARIWCGTHRRWHSQHAAYHCENGGCTPERMNGVIAYTDGKTWEVTAKVCSVEIRRSEGTGGAGAR